MIYGDCEYKKLFKNIDTSDEVIALLSEIHNGEKIYMDQIFESDPLTLRKMSSNLENMRAVFKKGVTELIDDLHAEDINDIDRAFVLSLRDHSVYWGDKITDFITNAQKAVSDMDEEHNSKNKALNDHIEDYVPMKKRPDKQIFTYINAEKRLISLREEDEARMVRIKITEREIELQKKLMEERTLTIAQKKERIKQHFDSERRGFLDMIETEWNRVIKKKHNEFEKLLVKYNKVLRVKDNVHHKENYRTDYLKNHKLDYKKPIHASKTAINQMGKTYFPSRKVRAIPNPILYPMSMGSSRAGGVNNINLAGSEVGPKRKRIMTHDLTDEEVWEMVENR